MAESIIGFANRSPMEIILFLLAAVLYFLPGIIGNGKRDDTAIWILNLFLGWTVIGWIVALVWAATSDSEPVQIVNNISQPVQKHPPSKVDEIERLKKLLDDGALTREEYEREKASVLKRQT